MLIQAHAHTEYVSSRHKPHPGPAYSGTLRRELGASSLGYVLPVVACRLASDQHPPSSEFVAFSQNTVSGAHLCAVSGSDLESLRL